MGRSARLDPPLSFRSISGGLAVRLGNEVDPLRIDHHRHGAVERRARAGIRLIHQPLLLARADGVAHQVAQEGVTDDDAGEGDPCVGDRIVGRRQAQALRADREQDLTT